MVMSINRKARLSSSCTLFVLIFPSFDSNLKSWNRKRKWLYDSSNYSLEYKIIIVVALVVLRACMWSSQKWRMKSQNTNVCDPFHTKIAWNIIFGSVCVESECCFYRQHEKLKINCISISSIHSVQRIAIAMYLYTTDTFIYSFVASSLTSWVWSGCDMHANGEWRQI